jgi:hypothetical protein
MSQPAPNRRQLELIITLPWLAAAVVMLIMTRIAGETQAAKLGLLGSSAICFSIGCLARTSLALHDQAAGKEAAARHHRPAEGPHGS